MPLVDLENAVYFHRISYDGYMIHAFVAGEMVKVLDGIVWEYFSALEKDEAIAEGLWSERRFEFKFDTTATNFGFRDMVGTYRTHQKPWSTSIRIPFNGHDYPFTDLDGIQKCNVQSRTHTAHGAHLCS